MFGLSRHSLGIEGPFEIGVLRRRYGREFGRVVKNRINDRTLSAVERNRWRAIAQQI